MAIVRVVQRVVVKRSRWFSVWKWCLILFSAGMFWSIWSIASKLQKLQAKSSSGLESLMLSTFGTNKMQEEFMLWIAGAALFAGLMWLSRGTSQMIEERYEDELARAADPNIGTSRAVLVAPDQLRPSPASESTARLRDVGRRTTRL